VRQSSKLQNEIILTRIADNKMKLIEQVLGPVLGLEGQVLVNITDSYARKRRNSR